MTVENDELLCKFLANNCKQSFPFSKMLNTYIFFNCMIFLQQTTTKMMNMRCFLMLSFVLAVSCNEDDDDGGGGWQSDVFQSKECAFTKSKPNSCLYFVLRNDLFHRTAADYCFDKFNGAPVPIYYSLNEAYEVMNRYYWWAKSDPNVPRLRFGVFDTGVYEEFVKKNNASGMWFIQTNFNPTRKLKKDMDMHIWNRSFPFYKQVFVPYDTYDNEYPRSTLELPGAGQDQYVSVNPKTRKWSNVNFVDKIPFICEVPRFPKAYCEEGWWLHMKSRSCFKLVTTEQSFTDSVMNCREIGSNIASINDETENNMVVRMIRAEAERSLQKEKVWFGLRHESFSHTGHAQSDKNSPEYAEHFAKNLGYNVDGTPVSTYTNFGRNQPDGGSDGATENCFLFKHDAWYDYDCRTEAWSLCRKMASTQPYSY